MVCNFCKNFIFHTHRYKPRFNRHQLPLWSFWSTLLYIFHLRLVLFLLTLCICVEWIPIKENIPNQGAMKFRWINMITFHFIKKHRWLYGYLKYRLIKKTRSSRPEVFLQIWQNSQENTCARISFLIKLQTACFIKNEALVHVYSCEFCEFLRTTFLQNTCGGCFWN